MEKFFQQLGFPSPWRFEVRQAILQRALQTDVETKAAGREIALHILLYSKYHSKYQGAFESRIGFESNIDFRNVLVMTRRLIPSRQSAFTTFR